MRSLDLMFINLKFEILLLNLLAYSFLSVALIFSESISVQAHRPHASSLFDNDTPNEWLGMQ